MSRLDVLRSLLRDAAERGRSLLPTERVGRVLEELRLRRMTIDDASLTACVARAPSVQSAIVLARDGALHVDVSFDVGDDARLAVRPLRVSFAPRGAKEITFRIDPPDLADNAQVRGVVGALAAAIAERLWGVVLGRGASEGAVAFVEEEAAGELRADLRSVPTVRALLGSGPAAMIVEMLDLEGVEVRDGGLSLRIGLPALGP